MSFRTFQVFFCWILEEASPFFLPFSLFWSEPPKNLKRGAPRDSFQQPGISPLSMGANLPGVSDRLTSATLLKNEFVAAYFFSSELPELLRVLTSSSLRQIPLRLTESGASFRSH
jgi:hypothetical protein